MTPMKLYSWIFFSTLFLLISCSNKTRTIVETASKVEIKENSTISTDVFSLTYSWAGLGSNLGHLAPMFVVTGTHYDYSMRQNSYMGKQTIEPENVCEGELSDATTTKIIDLVKNIEDSMVYNTNAGVMSGGIYTIIIKYQDIDVEFKLHNASDPIAAKIVDLLNSHIPEEHRKLSMWTD